MAIAQVAKKTFAGVTGGTSSSADTTGANFLVMVCACSDSSPNPTPSDSKSNTWLTAVSIGDGANNSQVIMFYAYNATVGTGHTFTVSGADTYAAVEAYAYSGVKTSADPTDQTSSAAVVGGTTIQAGSITPSVNDCLVIAGAGVLSSDGTTLSINGGFSAPDQTSMLGGNNYGSGGAELIQTTAAAANPTWTLNTSCTRMTAVIASFLPGIAPATSEIAITEGADVVAATAFANASMAVAITESADVVAAALGSTFSLAVAITESPDAIYAQLGYTLNINIASEEADAVSLVLENLGSWAACTDPTTDWTECADPSTTWTNCPDPATNWTVN